MCIRETGCYEVFSSVFGASLLSSKELSVFADSDPWKEAQNTTMLVFILIGGMINRCIFQTNGKGNVNFHNISRISISKYLFLYFLYFNMTAHMMYNTVNYFLHNMEHLKDYKYLFTDCKSIYICWKKTSFLFILLHFSAINAWCHYTRWTQIIVRINRQIIGSNPKVQLK